MANTYTHTSSKSVAPMELIHTNTFLFYRGDTSTELFACTKLDKDSVILINSIAALL